MSRLLLFCGSAVELHVLWTSSGLIRSVRLEAGMVDEFEESARAAEAGASSCPAAPSRCPLDLPGEGGRRHAGSHRRRRSRRRCVSADVADDDNRITLSRDLLGMTHSGEILPALIDSYGDNSDGWTEDLEDLHPSWNATMLEYVPATTARTGIRRR